MVIPTVAPLPKVKGAVPQVVPFTIRENPSVMSLIESMRVWIRDELTPFINDNIQFLADAWENETVELIQGWEEQKNDLIQAWNDLSDTLTQRVDQAVLDAQSAASESEAAQLAAEAARDLAQIYASQAEAIQDQAISGIISNPDSDSGIVLSNMFDAFADEIELNYASRSVQTVIESGRLSRNALDNEFVSSESVRRIVKDVPSSYGEMGLIAIPPTSTDFDMGSFDVTRVFELETEWDFQVGSATKPFINPIANNASGIVLNGVESSSIIDALAKVSYVTSISYSQLACMLVFAPQGVETFDTGIYAAIQVQADDMAPNGGFRLNARIDGENLRITTPIVRGTYLNWEDGNRSGQEYYIRLRYINGYVMGKQWLAELDEPYAWDCYLTPDMFPAPFNVSRSGRVAVIFPRRLEQTITHFSVATDGSKA